jgi:hypothetical protein
MATFCTECGFKNIDSATFCGGCGQKQGGAVVVNTAQVNQANVGSTVRETSESSLDVITAVVSIFIPILFALIIWLTQKDQDKRAEYAAKEILNFQLSWMVLGGMVMVVLLVLSIIGGMISMGIGAIIGGVMMIMANTVISLSYLVLMIVAAVKFSQKVSYRFPMTVRLIK